VRASLDLAHDLGLEVVAEGVENIACMRWLTELGCERAQGFLFSRPMPTEGFVAWIRQFAGSQLAWRTVPIAPPVRHQAGKA
jgi:EAL domain-containing protein (putative c-di-GMP-specific phosphodiesterase class I)